MNTYRVTCQELGEFVVELQANSIEDPSIPCKQYFTVPGHGFIPINNSY